MSFDWTIDLLSNQSVGTSTLRPTQHPTGLCKASIAVCDVITPTNWIIYFYTYHISGAGFCCAWWHIIIFFTHGK